MAVYNIIVNQGENFDLSATLTNSSGVAIDLNGYSLRGKAKYSYGSTGILVDLAPTITSAVSGIIAVNLTAAQTANLPITVAVYDIEKYTAGDAVVSRVLNGSFVITPEVTTS
jgi:hypothetical protein